MYKKDDKRRLYWLINQYLLGKIDESTFCNKFYYSYDLEVDSNTLTDIEKVVFAELDQVSCRFSQYEEDQKLDPRAFSTVKELKQKIIETQKRLQKQSSILGI